MITRANFFAGSVLLRMRFKISWHVYNEVTVDQIGKKDARLPFWRQVEITTLLPLHLNYLQLSSGESMIKLPNYESHSRFFKISSPILFFKGEQLEKFLTIQYQKVKQVRSSESPLGWLMAFQPIFFDVHVT